MKTSLTIKTTVLDYNGNILNVEYTNYDDDYQNESRTFWFDVAGETYGVCRKSVGGGDYDHNILDDEGYPINTDDAGDQHLNKLIDLINDEMMCEI